MAFECHLWVPHDKHAELANVSLGDSVFFPGDSFTHDDSQPPPDIVRKYGFDPSETLGCVTWDQNDFAYVSGYMYGCYHYKGKSNQAMKAGWFTKDKKTWTVKLVHQLTQNIGFAEDGLQDVKFDELTIEQQTRWKKLNIACRAKASSVSALVTAIHKQWQKEDEDLDKEDDEPNEEDEAFLNDDEVGHNKHVSARAGTQVVLSDDDEMSTAKTYDRVEQSTAVVANPKRGAGAKAGTPKAKAVTRTKSSPARKKDMSAGQCAPKVGKSTKVMKTKKPKKKKKGDSDEDGSDTDEDGDSEVGEDDEAFALDWFDKLALKDDTGERKTFRVPTVYLENLPEQDANPLLASFKTRPTNMKRVEEEAQEKVKAGRPGFHCSAIAFHCKEEDHTKLHTLMTNVQNKTANHKKEIFYLLAENHNVMSHKRAAERLKAVDSVKAKNFETFECYVLSYPTRERDEREDDYNARLKKIFKTIGRVQNEFIRNVYDSSQGELTLQLLTELENYWNGKGRKDMKALREYVKGSSFDTSVGCAFRQFNKKGKLTEFSRKHRAHQLQWSQQFKFLFKNCDDLSMLELYRTCIIKKQQGKLLNQDRDDRSLVLLSQSQNKEVAQEARDRLRNARDWKWSSYCCLPSITYFDQKDLLTKLANNIIDNTTFAQEIKRVHKLLQGFGELCSVLEMYAARNPSTPLGIYFSQRGYDAKHPFDAAQLYLMLNDHAHRDSDSIPWNTKMTIGKSRLEAMHEYDEFQRYMATMKGTAKQRKESMYSASSNRLNIVLSSFVSQLEKAAMPPKAGLTDGKPSPSKASVVEEDLNDDDEAPCSFHASGYVEVPRIHSWLRSDDGPKSAGKDKEEEAVQEKEDKEANVLGKKSSYVPQYTMAKVQYELWYGDVRKIDADSVKEFTKAHAAVGDCPYGLNTKLEYDEKGWGVDDFAAFIKSLIPLMNDRFILAMFCSHEQLGKFASFLRSSKCPKCVAVRELICRKVGQKLNDKPGAGGAKFGSNFESVLWAQFGSDYTLKKDGQEAHLDEKSFPFGFSDLPQKLKDNLRLQCFTCRSIQANQRYTITVEVEGSAEEVDANEYQKGMDIASHMIALVSKPGETVVDFCSGTGDFTLAGLAMGRSMKAMEGNLTQFSVTKDRVRSFKRLVAAPMTEPVDLPPQLMLMNASDKFQVDTAKMSLSKAKFFLHPRLIMVEPLGFGVEDWESLSLSVPGSVRGVVKEVEAAFKATAKYRVGMYSDFLWTAQKAFGSALPQKQKTIDKYFSAVTGKDAASSSVSSAAAFHSLKAIKDSTSAAKDKNAHEMQYEPSSSSSAAAAGFSEDVLTGLTHCVMYPTEEILAFPKGKLLSQGNIVVDQWKLVQRKNSSGLPIDFYDIAVKTDLSSDSFVRLPILTLKQWTYPQALYANLVLMKYIKKLPTEMNLQHPIFGFTARIVTKKNPQNFRDFQDVIGPLNLQFNNIKNDVSVELSTIKDDLEKKEAQAKRISQAKFKEVTQVLILPADRLILDFDPPANTLGVDLEKYKNGDSKSMSVPHAIHLELFSYDIHRYKRVLVSELNEPGSSASPVLATHVPKGFLGGVLPRLVSLYDPYVSHLDPCDDCFPAALVKTESQHAWANSFQYIKTGPKFRPLMSAEGKALLAENDEHSFHDIIKTDLPSDEAKPLFSDRELVSGRVSDEDDSGSQKGIKRRSTSQSAKKGKRLRRSVASSAFEPTRLATITENEEGENVLE